MSYDWMDDEIAKIDQGQAAPQASGWLDNAVADLANKQNPNSAPVFDRERNFAEVGDIVSDLTRLGREENLTREQYQDQIHGTVQEQAMRGMNWTATADQEQTDLTRTLSPEVEYKADVSRIMRSTQDPAIQERDIRRASTKIRKKMFDERFAPTQQFYTDKLNREHDEEKAGSRMMEWTDAWHVGLAGTTSGTLSMIGAKDWARAFYLATEAPELSATLDPDWIDKTMRVVGGTAPYIVATTVASALTGGLAAAAGASAVTAAAFGAVGGGMVSFGVEGNSAYQDAISAGMSEEQARGIGIQVGIVNAVIEMIGGSGSKYFRSSVKKGFSNRMKAAGKWTVERMKTALAEALEEAGQEVSTMVGESQYRKIDGKEIVDRVIMAGGAGFALGGAMDLTIGSLTRARMEKAESEPTIPTKGGGTTPVTVTRENVSGDVQPQTVSDYDVLLDQANAGDTAAMGRLNDLNQGIGERESYESLLDRATAGDEDAVTKIQNREHLGGEVGKFDQNDEGTLAVAGILRGLDVDENISISMSNEVRTLADQIKEGYETEESAVEMLKDGGLDSSEDPETIRVRGRNFRDVTNRVVIELHQGHDAGILLHEAAESYYRGVYGDAQNETISKLREEFEERTGITHDGNDMEWLSDGAVDYAVHSKIHERAGLSVRRMFNKYRKVFKQMLARVRNLRRSIESGSVPQQLMDIWDQPFKGRGTNTSAKQSGQSYKLTGPEGKIHTKFGTGKIKSDKLFIAGDGELLEVGGKYKVGGETVQDHEATAVQAGTTMRTVLKNGAIRLFKSGNTFAVETGGKPISDIQAEKIQQWLSVNFEPGAVIIGSHGNESVPMEFVDARSDIPTIVRNLQDGLDESSLLSYSYKLERGPEARVTYGQLVEGHLIPQKLKMTEEERRGIMRVATGKSSMKDLNYGQAEQYINALQLQAKAKGVKLSGAKTMAEALASIIQDHNTLSEEAHDGLEVRGLRALWHNARRKKSWYLLNQTRIERMIHALNGHEKGMLYNSIFMSVKESNEMATVNAQDIMMGLSDFTSTLGEDAKASLLSDKMFTHIPRPAGNKAIRWKGELNATGRISMYMLAKNKNGRRHLQAGNKYTDTEILGILKWQKKNRPDEIKVADYMLQVYDNQFKLFAAAHLAATGDVITREDAYSPIYIQGVHLEHQEDYLKALLDSSMIGRPEQRIGETEDRVRGANQPVQMDAFANFLYNTERVARYTAMAPTIVNVGKLINDRRFKSTLNAATHGYGGEIISGWLRDSARGYAADSRSGLDKLLRTYRKNSMTYVLGYKVPSALRQMISLSPAMAKDPKMIPLVIRSIISAPAGTKLFGQLKTDVYQKSKMMRTRNWDRVEDFINRSKPASMKLAGKTTLDEKALAMIKFLDRHTTIYAWDAAYQLSSQTMSEVDAIKAADNIVERSQPMGGAINLPAFFRGGTMAQLFTTFENQINQNYNYWAHDILGEARAGKISGTMVAYRVLMSYIIPAILLGIAGRGGLPEDKEDIMVDLATYPIAGFVLFGRWINGLIKGFGTAGTIIDVPVAEFAKGVGALRQKEPKYGKAALQAAKGVAAVTGKVPQAVFTAGEAVHRGATGLREYFWTPGQLKRKKETKKRW